LSAAQVFHLQPNAAQQFHGGLSRPGKSGDWLC
jgi:hypothetical protein